MGNISSSNFSRVAPWPGWLVKNISSNKTIPADKNKINQEVIKLSEIYLIFITKKKNSHFGNQVLLFEKQKHLFLQRKYIKKYVDPITKG